MAERIESHDLWTKFKERMIVRDDPLPERISPRENPLNVFSSTTVFFATSNEHGVLERLFEEKSYAPSYSPDAQVQVSLSPGQTTTLRLVLEGNTNEDIARALGISLHTVKSHLSVAYLKLKVESRTQAALKALQLGLLTIE